MDKQKNKKEKIINTARVLFNEKGYFDTKVEDITRKLEISKGNFYTYFSTKEDVLIEILERFFFEYEKVLQSINTDQSIKMILKDFIFNTTKFIESNFSQINYKHLDFLYERERTRQYFFKHEKTEYKFIIKNICKNIKDKNVKNSIYQYISNCLSGYFIEFHLKHKLKSEQLFHIDHDDYLNDLVNYIYDGINKYIE